MTTASIYLDNSSTTQMLPVVVDAMEACLRQGHVNPASQHRLGRQARHVLEAAREEIGGYLGTCSAAPHRDYVILTSGGTEANNLAIRGLVEEPGEILISAIEHPSALAAAERLTNRGFSVVHLPVLPSGHIDPERAHAMLTHSTRLVCVMLGNHEVGTLQPVRQLAEVCRQRNIPVHCDAVQVVGKLPVDFQELGVTTLAFSAHKFHGPCGVGGLILRGNSRLRGLLAGGSQQMGYRPGTESLALAVGAAKALEQYTHHAESLRQQLWELRQRLEKTLVEHADALVVGCEPRLPHATNVAFPGLDRQALVMALDLAGVACSTGSACTSGSSEPSHVLQAMGCSAEVVESSIRLSVSRFTTAEEVDRAATRILSAVNDLRT